MYSSSASLLCVYFAMTTRYPSSYFTTLSYRSNEYGTTNFKRESPKEKIVYVPSFERYAVCETITTSKKNFSLATIKRNAK